MWAVITGELPQYPGLESMWKPAVRLFDTFDAAHTWAIENPHYVTEVVEVTKDEEED
jgi:hypothetical protein